MVALRLTVGLALCLLGTLPAASLRAEESSREDQFKAAYLFNFVKFVEWPATAPPDVITVCFVGGVTIMTALAQSIETKRVGARRLAVKELPVDAAGAECSAVYIDAQSIRDGARVAAMSAQPVLTVSDAKSFTRQGGMIELFTDNNRLRFNINVDTAQRAGLRISSNLLQLAAAVERSDKP